jgi:uncharacterized protein involved in exopolysaccharide biosynthesis
MLKFWKSNAKQIAMIVFAVTLLSIAYSYVTPMKYKAYASIVPPDNANSGGGLSSFLQSVSGSLSIGGLGADNKTLLLGDFLKSREVAKYISDTLKLQNNPFYQFPDPEFLYDFVNKSIEMKIAKSGLIMLSAETSTGYFPSSADAMLAAKTSASIANAAIDGLDKLNRSKNVSKAKRKRIYIERILALKKHDLDSVDQALENFQKQNKVLALDDQTKAILEASVNVGSELQKAEVELAMKKYDYKQSSPVVQSLETAVQNLRGQYQRIQSGGILGDGSDYSFSLSNVPSYFRKYTNLIRNKKIMEQVNLYLETQRYQEGIQEQSDVPTIEALDKAVVPLKRESPSRSLAAAIGATISFICVLIVSFVNAMRRNVFFEKKEISNNG